MYNMTVGMAGKYKFVKNTVDVCGEVIEGSSVDITGWVDNILTDAGLDLFGTVDMPITRMVQCKVGSGNTTPTAGDTSLVSAIASTTTIQTTTSGVSGASPYYGYVRRTYRFALGAAAGNLSEVGIFGGAGNAICVSRALILDGLGDPTTITILADEVLDVVYEFRIYAPEVDVAYGPVTISGTDYSGTIRAGNVNSAETAGGSGTGSGNVIGGQWGLTYINGSVVGLMTDSAVRGLATQTLGAITATPTGISYNVTSITATSYTNGNYYRDHEILFDLNQGNIGGIGSMLYGTSFGMFQVSFTPKFDKDVTKRLRLNIRVSWGRYAP